MCTLTWLFHRDSTGYSLLFNRDELKTRKRAIPPRIKETSEGIRFLSPTDADAGGTWLAVNQFGMTICLLNYYAADDPQVDAIHSRGEVVMKLAGSRTIKELDTVLQSMTLEYYKGFEIVAVHNDVWHWRWDTKTLQQMEATQPITSSSYDTLMVHRKRQDYFNSLGNTGSLETLKHFHRCHLDDDNHRIAILPEDDSLAVNSVCMHREQSQTVSQCLVSVNANEISLSYTDGPPCSTRCSEAIVLNRREVA